MGWIYSIREGYIKQQNSTLSVGDVFRWGIFFFFKFLTVIKVKVLLTGFWIFCPLLRWKGFVIFIYFQVRALVVVHLSSRLCIVHLCHSQNASYNNLQRRHRRSRRNVVLALPMDTFWKELFWNFGLPLIQARMVANSQHGRALALCYTCKCFVLHTILVKLG